MNFLQLTHGSRIKLNRAWYRECRRELENRSKACIKKYWATVEEYKEANLALDKVSDDFDECFDLGISNDHLPNIHKIVVTRWCKLGKKKKSVFKDWVDVDQACLDYDFPD